MCGSLWDDRPLELRKGRRWMRCPGVAPISEWNREPGAVSGWPVLCQSCSVCVYLVGSSPSQQTWRLPATKGMGAAQTGSQVIAPVLGVCGVPTALLHVAVSWELVAKVETKTGDRSGSLGVRGYSRLGGGQVVSSFGKFLQSWCPGKSFCRRRE